MIALKNIAVYVFRYLKEVRRRNYLQVRVSLFNNDFNVERYAKILGEEETSSRFNSYG
jgi:hypothetical protein